MDSLRFDCSSKQAIVHEVLYYLVWPLNWTKLRLHHQKKTLDTVKVCYSLSVNQRISVSIKSESHSRQSSKSQCALCKIWNNAISSLLDLLLSALPSTVYRKRQYRQINVITAGDDRIKICSLETSLHYNPVTSSEMFHVIHQCTDTMDNKSGAEFHSHCLWVCNIHLTLHFTVLIAPVALCTNYNNTTMPGWCVPHVLEPVFSSQTISQEFLIRAVII